MRNLTTIKLVISEAIQKLRSSSIESPELNANYLAALALNTERGRLPLLWSDTPNKDFIALFAKLVQRRCQREPLQYIIGEWGFMDIDVKVNTNALIPRPETEEMVEEVTLLLKEQFSDKEFTFADIGTGTGVIGIMIAKLFLNSNGFCSDISFPALKVAINNINATLHDKKRLVATHQNLLNSFKPSSLDLIISNPPYISTDDMKTLEPEILNHEPKQALEGGTLGTELIFKIISQANEILKKNGILAIEHGHGQRKSILVFSSKFNLKPIFLGTDLGSKERFIIWKKA